MEACQAVVACLLTYFTYLLTYLLACLLTYRCPDRRVCVCVCVCVDTNIKDLVTPPSKAMSTEEQILFRDMYIKSHKSYAPGEQAHRKYNWTEEQKHAAWGAPSDQGKAEENVKESLTWKDDKERYVFLFSRRSFDSIY